MSARTRTAGSVAAGLRLWACGHSLHVRAAVTLLIGHDVWLRRVEFQAVCLHRDPGGSYWIDWTAAHHAYDTGHFTGSSTELAVLDLAIALGQDRYRFGSMGTGNARLIADAVAAAVGIPAARRPSQAHTNVSHDKPAAVPGSELTS